MMYGTTEKTMGYAGAGNVENAAVTREPTLTERLQDNLNVLNSIQEQSYARLHHLNGRLFGHHGPGEITSAGQSKLQAVASNTAGELSDAVQEAINRANAIQSLINDLSSAL